MEIILVKQTDDRLSDQDAAAVRRFLFQYIDGCNDKDKKAWRGWWRALTKAGSGEYFSLSIKRQRHGPFHRLVMMVLSTVYKSQERFDDFNIFRSFVKLGAGFVDYVPDTKSGGVRAVPKSQSFDDCSEEEVRMFFHEAQIFMRSMACYGVLWPHLSPEVAEQSMAALLDQFERGA